MTSRHSSAPLLEPGRLQTSAAPTVPHTPRPSMPKGLPGAVAGAAHRLGQPGRLAVDDHPGALGREVAGPEAGAAGGDDEPGEAGDQVAQGERDLVDAVGGHLVVDHRAPRLVEPLDDLGAGVVVAGALVHAVGHDQHLGDELDATSGAGLMRSLLARAPARSGRPARMRACRAAATRVGRRRNTALPATRMSTPAAAAARAVSTLMPPSISISTARPRASISLRAAGDLVEHLGDERLTAPAGVARSSPGAGRSRRGTGSTVSTGGLRVEHEADAHVARPQLVEQRARVAELDVHDAAVGPGRRRSRRAARRGCRP